MVVAAIAGAILLLAPATDEAEKSWWPTLTACVAIIVVALLVRNVTGIPAVMVAYGRYANMRVNDSAQYIYVGEGMTASVAVSKLSDGVLNYHNAGKVQASSEPQDMRLQRMLGHMTTLIPPAAHRVVVIGCGAGVTAGAVSVDPVVTNQTIAEIEPLVPKVVSEYFGEHNFNVVKNPKVHVRIDDARHYILTSREKFDAITSDPLDPWVKGAAMLYTREFFDAAKQHLTPGGVVTLFVQLYESNTAAVKSEIGTFFEAFPNGIVWGNTNNGQGYDLVLLGQAGDGPIHIDVDAIQARLNRPEYAPVVKSMRDIGFLSAIDMFSSYAGRAQDLKEWLKDAPINRDRNLRLQYLAGLGLNLYESGPIYSEILRYRKFPDDLFIGKPATISALRAGIQRGLDFRE
jgi:spermidine synthase